MDARVALPILSRIRKWICDHLKRRLHGDVVRFTVMMLRLVQAPKHDMIREYDDMWKVCREFDVPYHRAMNKEQVDKLRDGKGFQKSNGIVGMWFQFQETKSAAR